ncbi:MAG: class I SAM-dependent methyltransferase [Pyrinomonadaceae bacterium]
MVYKKLENETWGERKARERGERAVERQLDYQSRKSRDVNENPGIVALNIKRKATLVREKIAPFLEIDGSTRILEVGSGAHGLIFGFEGAWAVGVDPLADSYHALFPDWQARNPIVTAVGENLPFAEGQFDLILCDNVIDHAARPFDILAEIARVLRPAGILFFTVNTHHPAYDLFSRFYGISKAFGLGPEITPFADHTVHLTQNGVLKTFEKQPFSLLSVVEPFGHKELESARSRGIEGAIKRMFPKNILFEIIASKSG